MARIEISLIINRPVEDVFAFVSNSENLPRWRATALEIKKAFEGPPSVGGVFKGRFTFLGRQFEGDLVITAYEPDRTYATKLAAGPFPLEGHFTVAPSEGGTRLNFVAMGEPGGFFKLAEPLVVSLARRGYEADLNNLKELLEAQAV